MNDIEYPWDWHPKTEAEAKTWEIVGDFYKIANIAQSKYAGEEIIKGIASHPWGWNDHPEKFIPSLLKNPNLNPALQLWLDEQSCSWITNTQHAYWIARYSIDTRNINYTSVTEEPGPVRSFPDNFINNQLDQETAARITLEIADHFAEQLWHDLFEAEVIGLDYQNDDAEGDKLRPYLHDSGDLGNEEILDFLSPGYFTSWIKHDDTLDYGWAKDRAYQEWEEHFEELWVNTIEEDSSYSTSNLAFAMAAGSSNDDFETMNKDRYNSYLVDAYQWDETMLESEVTIISDTPWRGARYRHLTTPQQINLINNLLTTLTHPYLGQPGGITRHFLICLALHRATSDDARTLLLQQPIEEISAVIGNDSSD